MMITSSKNKNKKFFGVSKCCMSYFVSLETDPNIWLCLVFRQMIQEKRQTSLFLTFNKCIFINGNKISNTYVIFPFFNGTHRITNKLLIPSIFVTIHFTLKFWRLDDRLCFHFHWSPSFLWHIWILWIINYIDTSKNETKLRIGWAINMCANIKYSVLHTNITKIHIYIQHETYCAMTDLMWFNQFDTFMPTHTLILCHHFS